MRVLLSLVVLFLLSISNLFSQSNFVLVDDIILKGNNITKENIIIRELDISRGDTIFLADINARFEENEKRILNTGLFNYVSINIKNWEEQSKQTTVEISLKENWYIYPYPIFELADRNFNVWWTEQNRSFSRVNFGARISHINFSGRRDKLKLVAQFGYTRKYELEYSLPFFNKAQKFGIKGNIFYSENKEIGYSTIANKTQFHREDDERILLWRFRLSGSLSYRPELFHFHLFKVEFHRNAIDDIVANDLNADYFLNGRNRLRFFKLEYDYRFDKRIFRIYPENGFLLGINLKKEGIGIFGDYNNFVVSIRGEKYFKFMQKAIIATKFKAKTNLVRDKLAFANNTALGYGEDIIGGYELYVVDGSDYVLVNTSLRFNILKKLLKLGNAMPMDQFNLFGLKIYFTLNFDAGYVNERNYIETNTLNNKWVYGYGPGIDFILYNNYLLQMEYSFNQLGEKALYFHNKVSF